MAARAAAAAALLACLAGACSPAAGGVRPEAVLPATIALSASATKAGHDVAQAPAVFGFTFSREVTSGSQSWSLTAAGRAVQQDLVCRVRAAGPGVAFDRDLTRVDGRLWVRDHGGPAYREVAADDAAADLLDYCPAWPPGPAAAGLSSLLKGEPARHLVAGVEALGYRGDGAALAAALGFDLGAAAVDVFNLWIGAREGWLVEVNLSVSGPSVDLQPLLGSLTPPGGRATVIDRHRLDLQAAATPIPPPP